MKLGVRVSRAHPQEGGVDAKSAEIYVVAFNASVVSANAVDSWTNSIHLITS